MKKPRFILDYMLNVRAYRHGLLSVGTQTVSGSELAQRVEVLTSAYRVLPTRGLAVLTGESTVNFVAAFLALTAQNQPVAIASPAWTAPEREHALSILGEYTIVNGDGSLDGKTAGTKASLHPDTALVLFTSGSTGQARAVQLSRRNLEANLKAVITSLDFAAAREQVLHLPLSYSFGLLGHLLPALHLGLPTTLLNGFAQVPRFIAESGMRGMWSGVPPHWIALLRFLSTQSDLHVAPTHIVSAGGRLDLEIRRQMAAAFPQARLYNNYGLTEASPRLLSLPSTAPQFLTEAIGFPVGDWQIRVTADGELLARGAQVMLGYMHSDQEGRVDGEGWLHTGDLGRIDADGCVWLNGRADDLVKVAGERLSLSEVETTLASLNGVRSACVLARPHPVNGHVLEAYLELNLALGRGELVAELKKRLSIHKIPQRFFRVEALPTNANGKVDRRKVEDLRATSQALE